MAHVLLINDEPDLLEVCEIVLEAAGHSVTRALGSPNALLAAAHTRPDVVLLDLVMPGTTGEEVLTRFRDAFPEADTPVVVMSALEDVEDRAEAMGAAGFLAKPFEPDALLIAIDRALASSERRPAREESAGERDKIGRGACRQSGR